jgi:hypothetical protein
MIPNYHVGRGPVLWRIWWRFGWGPVIRLVNMVPVAEYRCEHWLWRIDIWAMDHIGKVRLHR